MHDGRPPEDRTQEILDLLSAFYAEETQALFRRLAEQRRAETTRRRQAVSERLAAVRRRLGDPEVGVAIGTLLGSLAL